MGVNETTGHTLSMQLHKHACHQRALANSRRADHVLVGRKLLGAQADGQGEKVRAAVPQVQLGRMGARSENQSGGSPREMRGMGSGWKGWRQLGDR